LPIMKTMAHFTASRRCPLILRPLLLALGLFVFTVAVFHDVLSAGFVRWDDDLHVYANPYLHPVSLAHLGRFWTAPYQNLYVPLSYTLYSGLACLARLPVPVASADGLWVDFDPRVFHAASLLLHGANVLLVFALLRRLLPGRGTAGSDGAACAGALLFAVHPLQVESVAWIAELRGLLAGFCCLAALHAWQSFLESPRKRRGSWEWYGWATLLFALALLAKPSAVALPLMAWALAWWKGTPPRSVLPTDSAFPKNNAAWRLGLAGWGALGLLALGVTHGAQPVTVDIVPPIWSRPWIAADALAFDLGKLLWPAHLGIDYGRSPLWLRAHGGGYATGTLLFALGIGVWALRRRCPALTLGASLFAAALLPTLGLTPFVFQVFSTVADRYLYLALLGPAFLLAWTLARLGHNPSENAAGRRLRLASGCLCAGVLLVCAERCSLQALTWRSSTALFGQALAVNPQSWAACNNLALIALDEGQPLDALPLLSEAVRLRPDFAEAHANRGVALLRLGARPAAEREFSAAVRLKPTYAFAYGGLGDSLMAQGRAGEAAAAFRQALALQPGSTQVREALRVAEGRALAVSR
jgi:tetratricopeptide (TPR) repeat protein